MEFSAREKAVEKSILIQPELSENRKKYILGLIKKELGSFENIAAVRLDKLHEDKNRYSLRFALKGSPFERRKIIAGDTIPE